MRLRLLILFFCVVVHGKTFSQCDPNVPTFTVDLSSNKDSVWISPNIIRDGSCCDSKKNERCLHFIVTLSPDAEALNFNVYSGAMPSGALFYQIGCGGPIAVGEPICLSGPGPHEITFCKPGNNAHEYSITSIPNPSVGPDAVVNDGCTISLEAFNFDPPTVTWQSVYPGNQGDYDSYLSCASGCLSTTVTATGTPPAYVDYLVCGSPVSSCTQITFCDTLRVFFRPTLEVIITPANPTICFGQTSTTLTANPSGGTPPYSYLWNNMNPTQTVVVGAGNFSVELSDASGYPPVK